MKKLLFRFILAAALVACSSRQDLGKGGGGTTGESTGASKVGETCSSSADCANGLRCLDARCGGKGAAAGAGGDPNSCSIDKDCAKDSAIGRYCKGAETCAECLEDAHCATKAEKHCKITASALDPNYCVECLVDGDCTDPGATRCSSGEHFNYCVECVSDRDCTDPAKSRCVLASTTPGSAPQGSCRE
jgi:hypothetical protein